MDILTKQEESNSTSEQKRCEICHKATALYSCPRCNKAYCTLSCYRDQTKHLECSEDFYEEQVTAELKLCQLEDGNKQKMVQILKKVAKELENDKILPDESDLSDTDDKENHTVADKDLIKAYETKLKSWTPWWLQYKESIHLKELNAAEKPFKFNPSLCKNSMNVDVSNANPLLLNDLNCMFYLYAIIAYVYQLSEDATNDLDPVLNEEIVLNFLKIDSICKKKLLKSNNNLSTSIGVTIKLLLNEQDLSLNEYMNKSFLIGLIDELIFVNESPTVLPKILSSLYGLMQKYVRSQKTVIGQKESNPIDETPLNVFYYNKEPVKKTLDQAIKKNKVQILTPTGQSIAKPVQQPLVSSEETIKRIKVFLKRLEFCFRWLNFNKDKLSSFAQIKSNSSELKALKVNLFNELEQFDAEKNFIAKNLNQLRLNQQNVEAASNKKIQEI